MTQRVTDYHFRQPFLTNLNATNSKMADLQRQISSGQRINTPEDDPFGTAQVLGFDSKIAETQQYQKNIADASGMLSTEEGAIDNVQTSMMRIRDLVVQAGNQSEPEWLFGHCDRDQAAEGIDPSVGEHAVW